MTIYKLMNMMKTLMMITLLSMLVLVNTGYSNGVTAGCIYNMTGTNKIFSNIGNCTNAILYFTANTSQNRFYCKDGFDISRVVFGNSTYNNTLYNCTFTNATVYSMRNASNNVISPYGTYKFTFLDNYSNIALGYYFNFVPLNNYHQIGMQGFATVMPYNAMLIATGMAQSQGTTQSELIQGISMSNYTLPRFGIYAPINVTNGNVVTFKLETEQIYNNRKINYNPYWFMCPFWSWDELTFKTFYIYGNMNFTPTLIYPNMEEDVQYPDNTNIYWNYTVMKYDNAPNMTAYLWSGYQVSPVGKIMHVVHNITNGTISYDVGVQPLGVNETIAVLKSPELMEHDNSTTETYGVGLSFCTDGQPPILIPGYYSLAYGSLHMLRTFWITNVTCATPLIIRTDNITVNCKGGTINSTGTSINIAGIKNVTVENCNIYGNALLLSNSNDIKLINSVLRANSANNIAIVARNSNLTMTNDTIIGYAKIYNLNDSNITMSSIISIKTTTTTTIAYSAFTTTTFHGALNSNNFLNYTNQMFSQKPHVDFNILVGVVLSIYIIAFAVYLVFSRKSITRKNIGKPRDKQAKKRKQAKKHAK